MRPPSAGGAGRGGGAGSGAKKSGGTGRADSGAKKSSGGSPRGGRGGGAGKSSGGGRGGVVKKPGGAGRGRAGRSQSQNLKSQHPKFQQPKYTSKYPDNMGGDQIEGRQSVRELLLAGNRDVREVFLVSGQKPAPILDDIIDLADEASIPIRQISRSRFDTISRTEAPQGIVALAEPLRSKDLHDLVGHNLTATPADNKSPRHSNKPFLIILDGVTDPHNLGALIRTGEAAGVTGFVLRKHRSPRISPTVTKSAAGAVEHMPIAQVNSIAGSVEELKKSGIWVVGMDESAPTPVWEMNLATEPVALVLGSEGKGLSRLVRQRCDLQVSIPLTGAITSLNVSVAGAIACFEISRQRRV